MLKRICPGCGHKGNIYDFSPSIEVSSGDFRIFHMYNRMQGPLYCNQCKRKHLLDIAKYKNLTKKQISFLENKIKINNTKYNRK